MLGLNSALVYIGILVTSTTTGHGAHSLALPTFYRSLTREKDLGTPA